MTVPISPRKRPKKRDHKRLLIPVIDNTTSHDTLTRTEFMKLRYEDHDSLVIEEEKEEEEVD